MLEKIIQLKNVGTFVNFIPNKNEYGWDGKFDKINIIYATNGSGKTTLSTILSSAAINNPDLIRFKHSINQQEPALVKLLTNSVGLIEFSKNNWDKRLTKVEIFNIHFIEDYLFSSSTSNERNADNLMRLLLGEKGIEFKNRYLKLRKTKDNLNKELKKNKKSKPVDKNKTRLLNENIEVNANLIAKLLSDFKDYTQPIFTNYIEETNNFLSKFSTNIRLAAFINPTPFYESEALTPALYIGIEGQIVRFKTPDLSKKIGSVKYTLSEGDKNAIALSFYLARLEILGLYDKIILIDDPLSSFDYNRKNSTVSLLASVATKCEQFFLLTHDIHFANSLTQKLDFTKVLNLKIEKLKDGSIISSHDIDLEVSSGLKKDLRTLREYENNKKRTESDKREVIRCFRPILETVLKTKYMEYLKEGEWLGDIIGRIRSAVEPNPLVSLSCILPDIISINDYSKSFHHSEFTIQNINSHELDLYIRLLKNTLLKI